MTAEMREDAASTTADRPRKPNISDGVKQFRHPVVGDFELSFNLLDVQEAGRRFGRTCS